MELVVPGAWVVVPAAAGVVAAPVVAAPVLSSSGTAASCRGTHGTNQFLLSSQYYREGEGRLGVSR